jgi:hypothetical protein
VQRTCSAAPVGSPCPPGIQQPSQHVRHAQLSRTQPPCPARNQPARHFRCAHPPKWPKLVPCMHSVPSMHSVPGMHSTPTRHPSFPQGSRHPTGMAGFRLFYSVPTPECPYRPTAAALHQILEIRELENSRHRTGHRPVTGDIPGGGLGESTQAVCCSQWNPVRAHSPTFYILDLTFWIFGRAAQSA